MRLLRIIAVPLVAACLLAACGGDDNAKGPPGSESNPLAAVPNPSATRTPPVDHPAGEAGAKTKSGAQHVAAPASSSSTKTQHGSAAPKKAAGGGGETGAAARPTTARKQQALPASASRPCSLVTKTQARAIVGAPIREPLQAPQGPTCIFQTKAGKPYVTVAVQTLNFAKLRKQIRNAHAVSVANRTAYCGTYGKPMLYLPLAGGRVLSIAGSCSMATRFAAKAAPHL